MLKPRLGVGIASSIETYESENVVIFDLLSWCSEALLTVPVAAISNALHDDSEIKPTAPSYRGRST
jgi:hypothetical protein